MMRPLSFTDRVSTAIRLAEAGDQAAAREILRTVAELGDTLVDFIQHTDGGADLLNFATAEDLPCAHVLKSMFPGAMERHHG